jgi:hypothetical protein
MKMLERRLDLLEQRTTRTVRRVHVICATDGTDKDRQIAEMLASGLLASSDGLLCITGRPAGQP